MSEESKGGEVEMENYITMVSETDGEQWKVDARLIEFSEFLEPMSH